MDDFDRLIDAFPTREEMKRNGQQARLMADDGVKPEVGHTYTVSPCFVHGDRSWIERLWRVKAAQAMVVERAADMIEDNVRHAKELGREIWAMPDLRALADTDGLALVQALREERALLRADRDSAARMWQASEQEREAAVERSREASQMLAIETNHAAQAEADRDRLAAANAALEAQVARLVGALSPVENMHSWTESAADGEAVIMTVGTVRRMRAALADPSGVEALAALRAERDRINQWRETAIVERDTYSEERDDALTRLAAAEAQVGALREAVDALGFCCKGCGRLCRDPEKDLAMIRKAGGLSCCPEREMVPLSAALASAQGGAND